MSGNSIVGVFLGLLVGAAFAGGGLYMYHGQQQAIQEHEPVEATVLETSVDREVTEDEDGQDVSYYPRVTYRYAVDGRTYTSSNLRPSGVDVGMNTREEAREFLEDYREGSQVTAYYDPQSPDEAFLVAEPAYEFLAFAGVGGLVALLSGYSLVRKVVVLAL